MIKEAEQFSMKTWFEILLTNIDYWWDIYISVLLH